MASYYGSEYSDQQSGNGGSGFYSNAAFRQPQQQPQPPPPQAFQQSHYGGGNTQQWTAPQPQQQPAQSSSSINTQQGFWNPAGGATVMSMAGSGFSNDAMLDLASTAGKTFLQSGSARMIPGLEIAMGKMRVYFAVDNRYVKRKMQKVLFPFLSKHWKRQVRSFSSHIVKHVHLS